MPGRMEPGGAVELAVRFAEEMGAGEAEAYAERMRGVSATVNAGAVRSVEAFSDEGIGVRVVVDGGTGFAYATGLDEKSIRIAVEEALRAARAAPRDPYAGLPFPRGRRPASIEGIYSARLATIEPGMVVERLVELVEEARGHGLETPYASIEVVAATVAVANSHGVGAQTSETWAGMDAGLTPGRGVPPISVYESSKTMLPEAEPLVEKAEAIASACRSVVRLDQPRRMPVVLAPPALAPMLHETLLAAVNASMIARGRSPYRGKLGELVVSEKLTIIDDPHMPGGDASTPFDAEGVPTARKPLIEKGVLRSVVSDEYWGRRIGMGSTGNAVRGGYSSQPYPSTFNVVVEPGDAGSEELLEGSEVLYVYEVRGAHTIRTETGEYSLLAAPAILYRGGEPVGVVKGAMIAGVMYADLASRVEMVGRRVEHPAPACYMPALRLGGVMVASQE